MFALIFEPYLAQLTLHKDNWDSVYGEGSFLRHYEYYMTGDAPVPDGFINFTLYYPAPVLQTFMATITTTQAQRLA
jgi:hypothetical protein